MAKEQEQAKKFHTTIIGETETSITLHVERADNEAVVFTYTPPYHVEFDFPGKEQQSGKEQQKAPEYPSITIEGNPAFKHKYDEKELPYPPYPYLLRLAHHFDPGDPQVANFYNVVAKGEKAREFWGLFITDTRMQLHITGSDISETVKKKHKGTAGIIQADSIEIIRGRKATSDILHEKVVRLLILKVYSLIRKHSRRRQGLMYPLEQEH